MILYNSDVRSEPSHPVASLRVQFPLARVLNIVSKRSWHVSLQLAAADISAAAMNHLYRNRIEKIVIFAFALIAVSFKHLRKNAGKILLI
jgi:hypothetical protein